MTADGQRPASPGRPPPARGLYWAIAGLGRAGPAWGLGLAALAAAVEGLEGTPTPTRRGERNSAMYSMGRLVHPRLAAPCRVAARAQRARAKMSRRYD